MAKFDQGSKTKNVAHTPQHPPDPLPSTLGGSPWHLRAAKPTLKSPFPLKQYREKTEFRRRTVLPFSECYLG